MGGGRIAAPQRFPSSELRNGWRTDESAESSVGKNLLIVVAAVRLEAIVGRVDVVLTGELDYEVGPIRELLRPPEDGHAGDLGCHEGSRRLEGKPACKHVRAFGPGERSGQCRVRPVHVHLDVHGDVPRVLVAGDTDSIHEVHELQALIVECWRGSGVLRLEEDA